MDNTMIVREWYDEDNQVLYPIRFIKFDDVWYAVLKDICDAMGLEAKHVAQRLEPCYVLKRVIPTFNVVSNDLKSKGRHYTHQVLLVNEYGIIDCISNSRKTEARKFKLWIPQMLSKLRQGIGMEAFQVMDLMDEKVQNHINEQLDRFLPEFDPYIDNIYFDETTGKLMQSITVAGGDVEQVEYTGDEYKVVRY